DPAGIGGEIICKSIGSIGKASIPVIIGDISVIDDIRQRLNIKNKVVFRGFKEGKKGDIELIDKGLIKDIKYGVSLALYGRASYEYIMEALQIVKKGDASAIVTCPINKASIKKAGINFPGHTEILADFSGVKKYVMMMANRRMKVSLVTIHIPLKSVPSFITKQNVFSCIEITHQALEERFRIKNPRIKVCGLNPHAGEQGIMGDEEEEIVKAIEEAKKKGINAEGPFSADTLFYKVDCDAFVAMYHDQGLIPVKTVDFKRTVNITLGLPFVRTSPGHGTGFDIAGKGLADPSGLIEAYRVAERLA
ncbi:MAG TPA: 4-hydroxythreonine-4-phosphate dehydrogenase PdxA, partial [Syntrophorhabdaceae bacterium]|nr:4-hydroxythreonine-4-phosphate dehydrogenase PdxA [Syntrophorhabdaceae bacterium]